MSRRGHCKVLALAARFARQRERAMTAEGDEQRPGYAFRNSAAAPEPAILPNTVPDIRPEPPG
jgi:hypothetical protein